MFAEACADGAGSGWAAVSAASSRRLRKDEIRTGQILSFYNPKVGSHRGALVSFFPSSSEGERRVVSCRVPSEQALVYLGANSGHHTSPSLGRTECWYVAGVGEPHQQDGGAWVVLYNPYTGRYLSSGPGHVRDYVEGEKDSLPALHWRLHEGTQGQGLVLLEARAGPGSGSGSGASGFLEAGPGLLKHPRGADENDLLQWIVEVRPPMCSSNTRCTLDSLFCTQA
jgi:hypothetical protein